jgi:hypothetical protein
MTTRHIRVLPFVLGIGCFFMTFVQVSCGGTILGSFTGVNLAVGTSIPEPQMFGPAKMHTVPPDIPVTLALAAGVAGLALATRRKVKPAGIAAFVGAGLLMLFKSHTESSLLAQGAGMLHAEYGYGFWGALVAYAAAGALAFVRDSALDKVLTTVGTADSADRPRAA